MPEIPGMYDPFGTFDPIAQVAAEGAANAFEQWFNQKMDALRRATTKAIEAAELALAERRDATLRSPARLAGAENELDFYGGTA